MLVKSKKVTWIHSNACSILGEDTVLNSLYQSLHYTFFFSPYHFGLSYFGEQNSNNASNLLNPSDYSWEQNG